MEIRADFLTMAQQMGARLLDTIVVRDQLHLAPEKLRPGAAARVRRGIRQLQAYLRRVILLLALKLERTLPADRPCAVYGRLPSRKTSDRALKLLRGFMPLARRTALAGRRGAPLPFWQKGAHVPAHELLMRLNALRALLGAPEKTARRAAWYLARRRPGTVAARLLPGGLPGRVGTEVSASFDAMDAMIAEACLSRPQHRGAPPRPPPRVRVV